MSIRPGRARYGAIVAFKSPLEAALAGDHISADTRVIASAVASKTAAVILMDPRWPQPDRVLCQRSGDGWVEAGSGSGGTSWSLLDDRSGLGVLASWGKAEPGASAVTVTFHGVTAEVPVTNGHWAWIVEGVRENEIGDPADFDWVF
jgi:hypothetical protein